MPKKAATSGGGSAGRQASTRVRSATPRPANCSYRPAERCTMRRCSRGGATTGARPGSRRISPSATRAPRACRTTLRATPKLWHSAASLGSTVPAVSR
ncbi:Uncharacterised protein [Bordetella pertussis]|nr:Uncharacterised protein [Bordetella pertussis]